MESEILNFLSTFEGVSIPDPNFLKKLIEGEIPKSEEPAAKLRGILLMVDDSSCYGQLSVFSISMANPTKEEWELSKQLCEKLLQKGLCNSIMLRQGCESKGLFGKRITPVIVSSPDFAKLAVLKRLELLDVSRLQEVVEKLDISAKHERYCENKWKALAAACKLDFRFAPVLASFGG